MLKLSSTSVVPALLLAAFSNVAGAAEYLNPKFTPKEHPVKKVLLLPAEIQLTKSGMKGAEGMAKESEALAEQITALITKELGTVNVTVLPNPFTEESLKQNEELQAALTRIQNKYDTLSTQLHSKPKDVRKGRYSLGDEVATLRPAENADAVIFIHGRGTVLTGGRRAFGALVTGGVYDTIRVYVSFADPKTGEIRAVVSFLRAGNFQKKTEKVMGKTLANSFKKITAAPK